MGQSYNTQSKPVVILPPSPRSLPKQLEIIPDEIFLNIFKMLGIWSIEAVARTCRRFRLIFESDKISLMDIICIASDNGALNERRMRNLEYPFELICLDSKLLPRPKFNLAVQKGEVKSSPGHHKKALLWIDEGKVAYKAFEAYYKSLSECPDVSILLLEGDPVFFRYKIPDVKQLARDVKQPASVVSCKYLCISGGCLSQDWQSLINGTSGPQWVYFKPGGLYNEVVTWTISTPKTLFIMESVKIQRVLGTVE
jgi:hypothetical protein